MKIINFKDIQSLSIPPFKCYEWVIETIQNKNSAILPPKISMKPIDGVFCNVMPSIIPVADGNLSGGVKVVTRYPNRVPSLESCILLMNANTGELLAFMDGTWITAMRTGAVAAHSILLFAKNNFSVIGMMGLGNTARATLLVLTEKIGERDITVKLLKYKGQESDFAARFSDYKNLQFVYVNTVEEMVCGSDVVISGATYLPQDICPNQCFDEGVLVVPIHTLGFTNCDLFFDKVFADDLAHVRHFVNFSKFKQFAEVCDVVNSVTPGRVNDAERIIVYNIGVSIHDIHFATSIYEMMQQKGILDSLPEADLMHPTEKFWV